MFSQKSLALLFIFLRKKMMPAPFKNIVSHNGIWLHLTFDDHNIGFAACIIYNLQTMSTLAKNK